MKSVQELLFDIWECVDASSKSLNTNGGGGGGGGGTTYNPGVGINISGSTISVDQSTVAMKADIPDVSDKVSQADLSTQLALKQDKLIAGTNIIINPETNVISATSNTVGTVGRKVAILFDGEAVVGSNSILSADSIINYDSVIIVSATKLSTLKQSVSSEYLVQDLFNPSDSTFNSISLSSSEGASLYYTLSCTFSNNGSTFTMERQCSSGWETYNPTIRKIYGVKYAEITTVNLPSGGTTGQVLIKKSDADDDFEWAGTVTESFSNDDWNSLWNS